MPKGNGNVSQRFYIVDFDLSVKRTLLCVWQVDWISNTSIATAVDSRSKEVPKYTYITNYIS